LKGAAIAGQVVKALDFHLANLGSSPTGTHLSHWWRQKVASG